MSAIIEPASGEDVIVDLDLAPDAGTDPSPAAAPSDQPAATEPAADESVHDYLMRNLLADDEEADPKAGEGDDPEPPADPEKEPAEEPNPAEEPDEQEPSKPAADPKPEPDKTAPTDSIKIVSRAEIESDKFKRMPKEIRDIAAANADAAEAAVQRLEAFGGEHFAEPMQMIAKGLLEDDNVPVIHGVLAAQGVDGFTGLMKDILKVSLIDTHQNVPKDEGARYFKEACEAITEDLFKQRFGEIASPALIEKLLKYEAAGALNTAEVDEYYAENGDGAGAPSPLLKEKEERIAELERKLAESEATETDAKAGDEKRHAETWTAQIVEESTQSLEDLYFKNSVLKPVKGDSPEMKAGKQQIKTILLDAARQFQQADPSYRKLQAAAYRGNGETAKYKKEKSALVENTVFHAKKLAAPLEALISQVYTLGRNANIPATTKKPASAGQPPQPALEPKEPTQTTPVVKKPMTLEEWNKHMVAELSKG